MGSLTKDLCALILTKVIRKGLCKKLIFEKRHKEARTRTVGKRKLPPKFQRTLVSGILKTQRRAGRATGYSGHSTSPSESKRQGGMLDSRLQTSAAELTLAWAGGAAGGSLLCLLTLLLLWLPHFPSLSVSGGAGSAGRQSVTDLQGSHLLTVLAIQPLFRQILRGRGSTEKEEGLTLVHCSDRAQFITVCRV